MRDPKHTILTPESLLAELRDEGLQAHEHAYLDGETIFLTGDAASALYIVESGVVQLSHPAAVGGREAVQLVGAGEVFGQAALAEPGGVQPVSATALTDATVRKIPRIFLKRLTDRRPGATLPLLLAIQQAEIARGHELAAVLQPRGVMDRLRTLLALLAQRFGEAVEGVVKIPLRLTHEHLAAMVASCREIVSRRLGELRERGVLDVEAGRVLILDFGGLAGV